MPNLHNYKIIHNVYVLTEGRFKLLLLWHAHIVFFCLLDSVHCQKHPNKRKLRGRATKLATWNDPLSHNSSQFKCRDFFFVNISLVLENREYEAIRNINNSKFAICNFPLIIFKTGIHFRGKPSGGFKSQQCQQLLTGPP